MDEASDQCRLLAFLPFTYRSSPGKSIQKRSSQVSVSHTAALLLAIEHFNTRNPSIVPLLENYTDCSVRIPATPHIVNSNADTEPVARYLATAAANEYCALIAPAQRNAAFAASLFATGLDVPLMAFHTLDNYLTHYLDYPRSVRVSENAYGSGRGVVNWFVNTGRKDFLASVSLIHGLGEQYRTSIENAASAIPMQHVGQFIGPPLVPKMPGAFEFVAETGYRNIFVAFGDELLFELETVANAAAQHGLIGPNYVWSFNGMFSVRELVDAVTTLRHNTNVTNLILGSAVLRPLDGFQINPQGDAFLGAWRAQNATSLFSSVNVSSVDGTFMTTAAIEDPEDDYFQTTMPEPSSSFMYDAVMALGLSKCDVQRKVASRKQRVLKGQRTSKEPRKQRNLQQKHKKVSIASRNAHVDAVHDLEFTGATGDVTFRDSGSHPGNRERDTLTFGVYNIQTIRPEDKAKHPDHELWYYLTEVHEGDTLDGGVGTWITAPDGPFVYYSGLTTPPLLNRDPVEMNLISKGVRSTGITLMVLAQLVIVAAALLVFVKRNTVVFRQNQPIFLGFLLFGALLMSFSILSMSFDERVVSSDSKLDAACAATPWLLSLGYVTMYFALVCKLWRIDKVLQFTRRKVKFHHVMGPFAGAVVVSIGILLAWTLADPFQWVRREINSVTGESYARCSSRQGWAYAGPLLSIMIVSTVSCGFLAYKTRDIDDRFSETGLIFYTIFAQAQSIVVGIPVVVILNNASADGLFLGSALLVFVIVVTTVLFMITPKAMQVFGISFASNSQRFNGGGNVIVTGINQKQNTTTSISSASKNRHRKEDPDAEDSTHGTTMDSRKSENPATEKEEERGMNEESEV